MHTFLKPPFFNPLQPSKHTIFHLRSLLVMEARCIPNLVKYQEETECAESTPLQNSPTLQTSPRSSKENLDTKLLKSFILMILLPPHFWDFSHFLNSFTFLKGAREWMRWGTEDSLHCSSNVKKMAYLRGDLNKSLRSWWWHGIAVTSFE